MLVFTGLTDIVNVEGLRFICVLDEGAYFVGVKVVGLTGRLIGTFIGVFAGGVGVKGRLCPGLPPAGTLLSPTEQLLLNLRSKLNLSEFVPAID